MGDQRVEASTVLRTLKREEEVGIKTRRKDKVGRVWEAENVAPMASVSLMKGEVC